MYFEPIQTANATRRAALRHLPPVGCSLTLAAATAWFALPTPTVDLAAHGVPWFDHIVAVGPVAASAQPFSNNAPLYACLLAALTAFAGVVPTLTLLKLLSLAGTVALAFAVRHLLLRLKAPQANRGAALIAVMPSFTLNADLMGQGDAIWAAACVMALAAAVDRRHATMLAWCGLALGFNAQAALVAPFLVALLINRRVPLRLWPIAPLVTLATMLPAWAAGWPAHDIAMVYLRHADHVQALSANAPNIWALLQLLPLGVPLFGLAVAAAIGAGAAYIARVSASYLDDRMLVAAALLAPLIMVGLLPHMHERFFFLADVLSLVLALTCRDRASWRIALLVQAGSSLGTIGYLVGADALTILGVPAMIAATWFTLQMVVKPAANDNPLMARTA